jgi:hypothetical protein
MTENICLMFTESESHSSIVRVLSLAAAAVDLHKRTVLYVGGRWVELVKPAELEQREREYMRTYKVSLVELIRHFQNAGGQLWVSALDAQQLDLVRWPLIQGATVVDDQTLLTFLTQGTVVLNF